MRSFVHKFIVTMTNTIVLLIANVNKSVVSPPSVGMDYALKGYTAPDNRLESGFAAIRDYFCVHLAVPLKDTENNRFAVSATPSFASNPFCSKKTFIYFYLSFERRFILTKFGDFLSHLLEISVYCVTIKVNNFRDLRGGQIKSKKLYDLPEFPLRNTGTMKILVNPRHY